MSQISEIRCAIPMSHEFRRECQSVNLIEMKIILQKRIYILLYIYNCGGILYE